MTDTLALELTKASDDDLHARTLSVARKEQQTTLELLVHLHEIERRKLFAALGYASLWDYSMKALGYSETQTAERVSAMRLMFRDEEARKALEEGALSLTQAAMAERHLRAEEKETKAPVSTEVVRILLSEVAGRSKRETEKVLLSYRPKEERPEKIHPVTPDLSEIRFSIPEETRALIERYWELNGRGSLAELFSKCLLFYLEEKDPLRKTPKRRGKGFRDPLSPGSFSPPDLYQAAKPTVTQGEGKHSRELKHPGNVFPSRCGDETLGDANKEGALTLPAKSEDGPHEEPKPSRYVSASVRRKVLERSKGACEYVDPATNRRCGSRFRVEFDHIHPHALGGTSEVGNMRILCRTHNQYLGDQLFSKNSNFFHMPLRE